MNKQRFSLKSANTKRLIAFALLIGWMALIFIKSNEPYQDQDIRPLLTEWFPPSSLHSWLPHLEFYYSGDLLTWREPYVMLEFFIRKCAHVMEYAILTVLWIIALRYTVFKNKRVYLSVVLTVAYAATDEWHQSFVAGRTGHAIDVFVDSLGMLLVMLFWLSWRWRNRSRSGSKK